VEPSCPTALPALFSPYHSEELSTSENVPSGATPSPWWQARALLCGDNWTDTAYGFGGPNVAEAVGTAEDYRLTLLQDAPRTK